MQGTFPMTAQKWYGGEKHQANNQNINVFNKEQGLSLVDIFLSCNMLISSKCYTTTSIVHQLLLHFQPLSFPHLLLRDQPRTVPYTVYSISQLMNQRVNIEESAPHTKHITTVQPQLSAFLLSSLLCTRGEYTITFNATSPRRFYFTKGNNCTVVLHSSPTVDVNFIHYFHYADKRKVDDSSIISIIVSSLLCPSVCPLYF